MSGIEVVGIVGKWWEISPLRWHYRIEEFEDFSCRVEVLWDGSLRFCDQFTLPVVVFKRAQLSAVTIEMKL